MSKMRRIGCALLALGCTDMLLGIVGHNLILTIIGAAFFTTGGFWTGYGG